MQFWIVKSSKFQKEILNLIRSCDDTLTSNYSTPSFHNACIFSEKLAQAWMCELYFITDFNFRVHKCDWLIPNYIEVGLSTANFNLKYIHFSLFYSRNHWFMLIAKCSSLQNEWVLQVSNRINTDAYWFMLAAMLYVWVMPFKCWGLGPQLL